MASIEIEKAKAIALAQAMALAAQQQPSVAGDVMKSGASGLARGTADLIGLPGTIGDALKAGGEWALRKGYGAVTGEEPSPQGGMVERFFAGPTPEVEAAMIGGGQNPLGGANLKGLMAGATGGATDYQPQTVPGEYARTGFEFLPAALSGPGGIMRKLAMGTIPAATSETAGQFTKKTPLEPWARAGGALAGGLASAGRVNPAAVAGKGAMTREVLKGKVDDIYTAMRQQGIKYDSNAWNATLGEMGQELYKQGVRPAQAPEVFKYVDDLMKGANHSLDFDDINSLHMGVAESARDAAAQGKGQLSRAWNVVLDKLDDFETQAPLMTTSGASQELLNTARTTARRAALQNIKQRTLDRVLKNAETYQGGMEAGIRTGLGNLLRSNKGEKLFTGPERTALLEVEQGRKALNTLSRFGLDITNLAGRASFIPAVGAGTIYAGGEPLLAGGLLAAGTAAKIASPKLTMRALEQAGGAIRSGKLMGASGEEITRQLKSEQTLRRLLSGQMGMSGSQSRTR